ncbi:hypothetical protein MMC21_003306 [Puttea exsequens]|nr:hypothetical protein [Puttea exsequens]
MPFIPHTPESLIPRSDSKNPATTCKGITAGGRPCRRPLATSPQASPTPNARQKYGAIAVLQPGDDDHDGAAAFFCWQHQDQAENLAKSNTGGRKADIVPLQERTSIDTLAERLGVLDFEDGDFRSCKTHKKRHARPARKKTLPQQWQDMDGPLLAVHGEKDNMRRKNEQQPKARSNIGLFCCVQSVDPEPTSPPRVRRHPEQNGAILNEKTRLQSPSTRPPTALAPRVTQNIRASRVSASGSPLPSRPSHPIPSLPGPPKPHIPRDPPSQTQKYLDLIPAHASPETTSALLAELAKEISPHDEAGYIYIFWLTSTAVSGPDLLATSSLLSNSTSTTTPTNARRQSAVLQAHASTPRNPNIILKIGRAANVQRRMNQWSRQCGYELSLLRYYPYTSISLSSPGSSSSAPPASAPATPSKVPHAHKVERLIHLELGDLRVKRGCGACGKEHREWFEVEGRRGALRRLDEVVRRWVEWDRGVGG